jgi:hypothetical protein
MLKVKKIELLPPLYIYPRHPKINTHSRHVAKIASPLHMAPIEKIDAEGF